MELGWILRVNCFAGKKGRLSAGCQTAQGKKYASQTFVTNQPAGRLDLVQELLSATEAEAKRVQALKEGTLDKAVKDASAVRENLSKDLVQATSEMTNKKSVLEAELAGLEAVKKVSDGFQPSSFCVRCIVL